MFSNYLPEKEKMEIKEFKFFHGITLHSEGIQNIIRALRLRRDTEEYFIGVLAEEISYHMDEMIVENELNLDNPTNIEI